MTLISIEDVMKLLDVQTIPGKPWQLERFRKWIESLAEKRGVDYVWENKRNLLNQWEQQIKAKSKSPCC